eukprot:8895035-Alexandrium_andersonii.AAC.1
MDCCTPNTQPTCPRLQHAQDPQKVRGKYVHVTRNIHLEHGAHVNDPADTMSSKSERHAHTYTHMSRQAYMTKRTNRHERTWTQS